ncbi:MAG: SRPBCC family protein [Amphiplicatus sp.]
MPPLYEKAEVSLPSDREVKVTRSFHAPRALVYRAYTEPALLQKWMLGPPGWTMPVCEMDVRAGGKYRWRWRSDEDGKEFGFFGVFREVETNARLVHTQTFDPGDVGGSMGGEAVISVVFAEHDGVTTVTTLMDFGSKEAREAAMSTGMTDGMEMSYQQLDKLLAKQS